MIGLKNGKKGFLSAAVLKHTAYLSMLVDHFSCVVLLLYIQGLSQQGQETAQLTEVYNYGRDFGRIAFVLFAYMAAQGFLHTHNALRYLLRLGIFALLSEVPFDLALYDTVFTMQSQNVYFTLFFGVLALYWMQKLQGHIGLQIQVVLLCMMFACLLKTDYMFMGVLLIVVLYQCRNSFWKQALFGSLTIYFGITAVYAVRYLPGMGLHIDSGIEAWVAGVQQFLMWGRQELYGLFAFVWIYFYNGEKGRQLPKYFYYLFYPVHLLVLYLVKVLFL